MSDADTLALGPLQGTGTSGLIAQSLAWEETPLGPIAAWSPRLKSAASLVLHSPLPMALLWGPELVVIHNDACFYAMLKEGVHEGPMGSPAREAFRAAWSIVGPELARVMREGEANARDNHMILIDRGDRVQEAYFSYTQSPVFEEDGQIGGILVTHSETTAHVVAERRIRTLYALADALADESSAAELLPKALAVFQGDFRLDVPFVIAFDLDRNGAATVRASTHPADPTDAVIARIRRCTADGAPGGRVTFEPLVLPDAPWPEPIDSAYVLEVPAPPSSRCRTVLAFGVSPRLPLDDAYRAHLTYIVELITRVCARVEASEARVAAEARQRDLLLQASVATFLTSGPEHRFELANEAFLRSAGRQLLGKTFAEAFPELSETEVPLALDRVYRTGEPHASKEQLMPLKREGVLEDRWFSFSLQAVRDGGGMVTGIVGTAHEITDAVAARRSLERLVSERERLLSDLEAANRSKDEFLAMLGHELRNPLAPISTALHLMQLKEPNVFVRERAIIARQAAHLVHLVDDLLDVSRVARGKVRLDKSRVSLSDVITRAVEMASPLFEERRHNLVVDVPSLGLDVFGDPTRLEQVFANLLTNAAKYTEPAGHIAVRARREGDAAVVRVEDDGAGIGPEQLTTVFDTFFQGPRMPDRATGGLGLGLALVKSFVTLHGGEVSAHSPGPGQGSVFEVRLPALAAEVVADTGPQAPRATEATPARRRVLVVDDSRDIVELVSTLLRHEGYEVLEAHDGPSALQVAPSFRPDVAVLDIGLPAMDGYDLAQHLQDALGDDAPKLIAMTGYGQQADRERARQAGFAVHLVKPVDPATLLESIRA